MRGTPVRVRAARAAAGVLVAAAGLTVPLATTTAHAAVPDNFTDELVIGGLDMPTVASFAPDGRVFIGEKGGVVKTFDSIADDAATTTVDLSAKVHDYWDRGLLGLAVHPQYPAQPYVYALYSYDQKPGGGQWGDTCPNPPGGTTGGCVISGRLSKLTVDPSTGVASSEQPLVTDWCQQFPSHSIGTVTFGPDGNLYVGGGDGANFNWVDFGQNGNPCGDPPVPAGTNLTAPDSRGGALRSQSPRRPVGEPRTLDGTIARVDPDTGARQIVAYGLRNQFRFGFRPGTKELWVGDVGWNTWEEINRIPDATTDTAVENFGWPCYEGTGRQSGYDGKDLTACETLYNSGGQNPPYYTYRHDLPVVTGDGCALDGSAINGVAFEQGDSYPPAYDGAMFFADSSRGCIWAMRKGENGLPNPADIVPFVTGLQYPVQTLIGPGGHLYYVALGTGELRRVLYTGNNHAPSAQATATPSSGPAPLTVQFNGSASSDVDGDALTYRWDLDADGQFDDGTGPTASRTYVDAEVVQAKLRVSDPDGLTSTTTVDVTVGEPVQQEPVVVIDTPAADLKWHVDEQVSFSGRASDPQEGPLGAAAMDWTLTLQHCTTPSSCHPHQVQSFADVDSGQFSAPDHSYPSYLDLKLTATDAAGNKAAKTVRLEPETVELTFESSPSGLNLTVGDTTAASPFTRTVIVGSDNSLSAPSPQGTAQNTFVEWSDSGSNARQVTASAPKTYQASFVACAGVSGCGAPTPTAPRGISAVASGDTATVSWQAPYWPGTGGVTKYKVTASNGKVYDNLSASATSQTVTGLTGGQTHTFTVTPYSSAGAGKPATDKLTGTKLTSSTTAGTITYGSSVQVKGTFTRADTGSLLTSKPVELRGRAKGTTDWEVLATGTTNSSGVVSFTRSPDMNYEYQLAFTGSSVYGGSLSPVRAVNVRTAVTAAFADSTVRVGQTVELSGRVDPPHPGQSVRLQYYYGGEWRNSLLGTLSADSTYTFTFSKSVAKTYTYRVVKYGDSDHVTGVSPTRTLTVS